METTPARIPDGRLDRFRNTVETVTPVGPLVAVAAYARTRVVAVWRDERGLSKTVEMAIWCGVGLVAALGVGTILINALRNRATGIGNDIENSPLP